MESKATPVEARAICSPQPIRFLENVTNRDRPLLQGSKKILAAGEDPGDG